MDEGLFPEDNTPRLVQVWDCESTGFPEDEKAEVIELGRYHLDLITLDVHSPFEGMARPVKRDTIPVETMAVHHIRDADVAGAPKIGELWRPFWDGCGPNDLVAAHNAKFEKHFHAGNGRRWICTYKAALVVWPDAPGHSNQVLRYWLGLDEAHEDFDARLADPPHRALPDAYVTAHILAELLKHRTWEELVEISKWPALLCKIRFGTKHKGQLFSEAPSDYLEWIRDKSSMDEDVKFTAKYWLQKRAKGEA